MSRHSDGGSLWKSLGKNHKRNGIRKENHVGITGGRYNEEGEWGKEEKAGGKRVEIFGLEVFLPRLVHRWNGKKRHPARHKK